MDGTDNERLVKAEERGKSNSHRIDRLESLTEAINRQNENIARLVEKLESTNLSVEAHERRLSEIEKQPRSRQNAVFASVITAVLSAVFGAVATLLFSL